MSAYFPVALRQRYGSNAHLNSVKHYSGLNFEHGLKQRSFLQTLTYSPKYWGNTEFKHTGEFSPLKDFAKLQPTKRQKKKLLEGNPCTVGGV